MPKRGDGFKDLSGQKFGHLKVLSFAGRGPHSHREWNTKCDLCGSEKVFREYSLKSKTTCGCDRFDRHRASMIDVLQAKGYTQYIGVDDGEAVYVKHDLQDRIVGKLKVIKYRGNRLWECLCECGNRKLFPYATLCLGKIQSCGCLYLERMGNSQTRLAQRLKSEAIMQQIRKPIDGQVYGKLTVIQYLGALRHGKHPKSIHGYWLCQCECGNFKIVSRTNLVQGRNASCGCLYEGQTALRNVGE